MSKVGKNPIAYNNKTIKVEVLPGGVYQNLMVKVNGPKGNLSLDIRPGIKVKVTDTEVVVERENEEREIRGYHGLYRTLIANMVDGVVKEYEKKLEIHGVGYRGAMTGRSIELNLGFSHPVKFDPPEGITLSMPDQNTIVIAGIDKQLVGQIAAKIRTFRKPEPYKGKGIRYEGERVRRKAGKAGGAAA